MAPNVRPGGRPRDPVLDERILTAARQLLAERGYRGLSVDAVAKAAGTTRPTVYLRFAGKENLATSAVAGMPVDDPLPVTEDVRTDLVAEMRHFRTAVTRPHGMSFVGTALAEEHLTPALLDQFRQRLVLPRRRRVAARLTHGVESGVLRADLDTDAIATMLIGSLYARYLASSDVPPDWPERVVDSLWPAIASAS